MFKSLKLISVILTCLILAYGCVWAEEVFDQASGKSSSYSGGSSSALAKSYDDLYSISTASDLIVRAEITDFTLEETNNEKGHDVQYQAYNLNVQQVYKNESDPPITDLDHIQFDRMIGIKSASAESFYPVEDSPSEIEPGIYLLFLNAFEDSQTGNIHLSANPNHLYQWRGTRLLENVASNKLERFSESELIEILGE